LGSHISLVLLSPQANDGKCSLRYFIRNKLSIILSQKLVQEGGAKSIMAMLWVSFLLHVTVTVMQLRTYATIQTRISYSGILPFSPFPQPVFITLLSTNFLFDQKKLEKASTRKNVIPAVLSSLNQNSATKYLLLGYTCLKQINKSIR